MNKSSIYYLVLLLGLPFYIGCSENTPTLDTTSQKKLAPEITKEIEQNGCIKSFTISEDSCGKGSFYSHYGKDTKTKEVKENNNSIIHHKLPSVQGEIIEIDENGEDLNFLQYSDKIVLLEVFGKECMFCTKQGRILNMLKNSSKGKIQLIGLQVEGRMNPKETKKIFKKHGIRHPVIEGEDAEKLQDYLQFKKDWDGILPFILIIDKEGKVRNIHHGLTSLKELKKDVLDAQKVSTATE